jgi:lysyl-tRNA synthetase, class II
MAQENPAPTGKDAGKQADIEKAKASAERTIIDGRKAKAEALRSKGQNPFANQLGDAAAKTMELAAIRVKAASTASADGKFEEGAVATLFGTESVHVRGRVIAYRTAGGLSFLKLRDGSGELQLLCDEGNMGAHYTDIANEIDVGDIAEAMGTVTASKRGELSLRATRVRVVSKSFRPLPEKWHGLTDVETRYRQRYVDLIANPEVSQVFRARSAIIQSVRKLLDDDGYLEVETPTLNTLVGGAAARPFQTHHNALDLGLFMRIAPELYLKRLLVGGFDRVYEIGRCYRNEGLSTRHNPEFTMLEFYRAYATYAVLMDFAEVLLRQVDAALATRMPAQAAAWKAGRPFTFDEPFVRLPMAEAVRQGAKRTQIQAFEEAIANDRSENAIYPLCQLLSEDFGANIKEWSKASPRAKSLDWGNFRKGMQKCENHGERLFALYEYLVEPFLAEDYRSADGSKSLPVFVMDYPAETSPLARRNDKDPRLVDRFELFVHGRELCNAFSELNDPDDQAARFQEQVAKKAKGADETMDFDADYVRALEYGMPPAAGFGMGIDRLVMMLTNQSAIRDVILFPLLRPE